MKAFILFLIIFVPKSLLLAQTDPVNFIKGADVSFTQQIEDLGGKYKDEGVEKDVLEILESYGINYIRLRIWNNPRENYSNLEKILIFAQRIQEHGMKFLLNFHYSDWWADPGKQNKPAAWEDIPFEDLKDSVYSYTYNVISALKNQNTLPDMVQIGNEITGGMLWPDGKIYGAGNEGDQWIKFTDLLKRGIEGVEDASDTSNVKIMIHIDRGGDYTGSKYFYDHIIARNVSFDVIGLSFYPWWHGTFNNLKNNLNNLSLLYGKEIVVVETAYPMNNVWLNDGMPNVSFDPGKLLSGYPVSVAGQKDFLIALTNIISDTRNGNGAGFFYWEPTYISVPPIGSSWEYYTLFDPVTGDALNSLSAFQQLDSMKSIKVKIRLNTSTHSDTLNGRGFVQIVGQINGTGTNFLPGGERITWDRNSDLIMENIDGDNWEYELRMFPEDQLEFKFWTGHDKNNPTKPRLGWEGPIIPFDGSNKNARLFDAGYSDSTLELQFYNSTSEYLEQYISPFNEYDDSVGIMFRVYLGNLFADGIFGSSPEIEVAVRGDSSSSSGVLNWNMNNAVLDREEFIYSDSSFWSKIIYFPRDKIIRGTELPYKFIIHYNQSVILEDAIDNRKFIFPSADSTLAWQYFNNRNSVTKIRGTSSSIPHEIILSQNYPNPFNPTTKIKYEIPNTRNGERAHELTLPQMYVKLTIYDILGNEIATLVNESQSPGNFEVNFNAAGLSGGVYFYRLTAGEYGETKKMILLR